MKNPIIRYIVAIFAAFSMLAFAACDTGNGVGEGLEDAGDSVEDTAEDAGDSVEDAVQ